MPSTPERVRQLIADSGLTQRTYADRIGLDTTKLSKSLTGARRFTSLELARIAELSRVTVDWLITGAEPELTLAARSSGGSARIALGEAERLSVLRGDLAYLGFPQAWRPLPISPSGGTARAQGTALAESALARLKANGAWDDLPTAIEAAFGADVAIADLGENFDGLSVGDNDTHLIVVATSPHPGRQRFTIAHELGHLLQADDGQVHVDSNVYASAYRQDPVEQRANAFAAALLMPEPALRQAVGPHGPDRERFATLAHSLDVTPSALAFRLRDLRLIDAGTCDRFRVLSAAEAARLAGRSDEFATRVMTSSGVRRPGLLARDAYQAYESGASTLRPYASLLGMDPDKLLESLERDDSD